MYSRPLHVGYTCTRAHPQRTSREEKRACRTKVRGQVGEEVRVGVGVCVRVGPEEFKLIINHP